MREIQDHHIMILVAKELSCGVLVEVRVKLPVNLFVVLLSYRFSHSDSDGEIKKFGAFWQHAALISRIEELLVTVLFFCLFFF